MTFYPPVLEGFYGAHTCGRCERYSEALGPLEGLCWQHLRQVERYGAEFMLEEWQDTRVYWVAHYLAKLKLGEEIPHEGIAVLRGTIPDEILNEIENVSWERIGSFIASTLSFSLAQE